MINCKQNFNNLPAKLKKNYPYCCYQNAIEDNKIVEVPYSPVTTYRADVSNRNDFASLDATIAEANKKGDNGVAVGLFDDLGVIVINQCIDENNKMSDMAAEIMDEMQTYTEYSSSGADLTIFFTVSDDFQFDTEKYYMDNHGNGVSVYVAGYVNKFIPVTGNSLISGRDLEERDNKLAYILEKYMLKPPQTALDTMSLNLPSVSTQIQTNYIPPAPMANGREIRPYTSGPDASFKIENEELIDLAKGAKNGALFSDLMNGDLSNYNGTEGQAVMELCQMLAFWTEKNPVQMNQIFHTSGLMYDEWDRPDKESPGTQGENLIRFAIALTANTYNSSAYLKRKRLAKFRKDVPKEMADFLIKYKYDSRYSWDDIGNGYLFADYFKNIARYVPERKKWYIYDGTVWKPDNEKVMELCKSLAIGVEGYIKYKKFDLKVAEACLRPWKSRHGRERIMKDAESVYPVNMSDFDKDPYLFNCKNGTLDLRTMQFNPHSPEDMLSKVSGVYYDPQARCDRWESHMAEIMLGDQGKVEYLQKALGYSLTGDTKHECFFILYGATSRNGKGVTMETFMNLMGDYGKSAKPDTITQKQTANGSGPSEDIARLAGARFVNISEPDKNMVLSSALVKTLTGNDKITARYLHENSFEYYPQFKLFINTNYLPKVNDVTIFSSGRVKLITFNKHFTEAEQDKGLKRELSRPDNLSGILNWCIQGLWGLQQTEFEPPDAVKKDTEQYRYDSDKITRFVEEMLEPNAQCEILTETAFAAYQAWCARNGQYAEAQTSFKQSIQSYVEIKRKRPIDTRLGTNPRMMIVGYRLRSTY